MGLEPVFPSLSVLYILYALVFLVIAGVEATIIRIQLIRPHNDFVSPQVFNRMFTMHGTTIIFFVVIPVMFGFANYLVPLMIGARDMAFPRLNAFSFWLTAFGGFLLYFSFLGGNGLYGAGNAPEVGWWAYAPQSHPGAAHGNDRGDEPDASVRMVKPDHGRHGHFSHFPTQPRRPLRAHQHQ